MATWLICGKFETFSLFQKKLCKNSLIIINLVTLIIAALFQIHTATFRGYLIVIIPSQSLKGRKITKKGNGGDEGIRTLDELLAHTPLAGERLRPLGHVSVGGTSELRRWEQALIFAILLLSLRRSGTYALAFLLQLLLINAIGPLTFILICRAYYE